MKIVVKKMKKAFAFCINSIKHPVNFWNLIIHVKKGNIFYVNYIFDNFYLKYGKIVFPKSEKPVVSIIIPVYNQSLYTIYCLRAIYLNTVGIDYEVIIADDVSDDGTRFITKYFDNLNVIRNEKNLGFLLNCNNAAKYAKGKYLLFLNNDTSVKENWLKPLIDTLENNPDIGLVGSKFVFPNGKLQEAGGIIFNDGTAANYGKYDEASKPQYNYLRDVDYISGASIMISNSLWKIIGGFDSTFAPAYCEDSDLAFQVRKHGLRVVYQPLSVVTHYEGISNGNDVSVGLKKYQVENTDKLLNKWQKEISLLPDPKLNKNDFTLRDRVGDKKTILVIDQFVPEFDKDAGSKTTFQYLQMFIKMGYNVKFLGDNFFNKEPYTTILEQMNIEVLYGSWYANHIFEWILDNKDNIDIVYANRPHITIKYIDFIKNNTDIKIIYYGHDLHYLREQREYELTNNIRHKFESEKFRKIEYEIMQKADVVYYPSYVEKKEILKNDSKINIKAINAYYYDELKENYKENINNRKGLLFIGGFNHRPNVDAVIWFVKEVYPSILEKQQMPLIIAGSNPPVEITSLKNQNIKIMGYVSTEELNELYNDAKMTIAPLRYGAGIKGKVIEAASNGVPMVTTSVGAEGLTGYEKFLTVTDDPIKMAELIIKLYNDNDELCKLSNNAIKFINENYSMQAAWNIIKDDFNVKKKLKNNYSVKDNYDIKVLKYFLNCKSRKELQNRVSKLIDNDFQINKSEERR